MSNVVWIRTKQWHVLRKVTDAGWETRCGDVIIGKAKVSETLPARAATCNTCSTAALNDRDTGA